MGNGNNNLYGEVRQMLMRWYYILQGGNWQLAMGSEEYGKPRKAMTNVLLFIDQLRKIIIYEVKDANPEAKRRVL